MDSTHIVRVLISGSVQKVGFRAWAERQALTLGVEGWARNRRDGQVECLFAGAQDAVERMIALCRDGPARADVTRVTAEPAGPEALALRSSAERFEILPTL